MIPRSGGSVFVDYSRFRNPAIVRHRAAIVKGPPSVRPAAPDNPRRASSCALQERRTARDSRRGVAPPQRMDGSTGTQVQSFKPDVWDGFAKFGTRLDERVRDLISF